VVAVYLQGKWWPVGDVLKTSNKSRCGLVLVSSIFFFPLASFCAEMSWCFHWHHIQESSDSSRHPRLSRWWRELCYSCSVKLYLEFWKGLLEKTYIFLPIPCGNMAKFSGKMERRLGFTPWKKGVISFSSMLRNLV